VEYWIRTANCRPHQNEWLDSPLSAEEIITGQTPDVSTDFLFPFGCPVTSMPPTDRSWKYAPTAELGIAVGSSGHRNGATLVFVPGKGTKPRERLDVTLLKVPPITASRPTSWTNLLGRRNIFPNPGAQTRQLISTAPQHSRWNTRDNNF
jgi:hypothetical protein